MPTGTQFIWDSWAGADAVSGNNLLRIRPCAGLEMDHDRLKSAALMAADVMIKSYIKVKKVFLLKNHEYI